jgi:hypothetical protein
MSGRIGLEPAKRSPVSKTEKGGAGTGRGFIAFATRKGPTPLLVDPRRRTLEKG